MSHYYGFFFKMLGDPGQSLIENGKSCRCWHIVPQTLALFGGLLRWWNYFPEKWPYISEFNQTRTNGLIRQRGQYVGQGLERESMAYLGRFKRNTSATHDPKNSNTASARSMGYWIQFCMWIFVINN